MKIKLCKYYNNVGHVIKSRVIRPLTLSECLCSHSISLLGLFLIDSSYVRPEMNFFLSAVRSRFDDFLRDSYYSLDPKANPILKEYICFIVLLQYGRFYNLVNMCCLYRQLLFEFQNSLSIFIQIKFNDLLKIFKSNFYLI